VRCELLGVQRVELVPVAFAKNARRSVVGGGLTPSGCDEVLVSRPIRLHVRRRRSATLVATATG
jgi:hypothetical protein